MSSTASPVVQEAEPTLLLQLLVDKVVTDYIREFEESNTSAVPIALVAKTPE